MKTVFISIADIATAVDSGLRVCYKQNDCFLEFDADWRLCFCTAGGFAGYVTEKYSASDFYLAGQNQERAA